MVYTLFSPARVLRQEQVPVLAPGSTPFTILHFSDLHLTKREKANIEWLKSLETLNPDLVISTGDHLASVDAVDLVPDALAGLMKRPGAFVLGSNDYYAPILKSPHRYLFDSEGRTGKKQLPWRDLVTAFTDAGWHDLSNTTASLTIKGIDIELRGTDDAHLRRDDYQRIAGPQSASLTIGVTHAPYRRILDAMTRDGIPLILAGHTHGGQWRLPWPGGSRALVTNCDLPASQARGLSRYQQSWLHVSAGVGASPFTPLRIACAPEVSLLTLVPAA